MQYDNGGVYHPGGPGEPNRPPYLHQGYQQQQAQYGGGRNGGGINNGGLSFGARNPGGNDDLGFGGRNSGIQPSGLRVSPAEDIFAEKTTPKSQTFEGF